MHSDAAISVKNLTKTYRIFGHPGDRIKQALTLGRMRFHREFTALKDVSFEINKGETVGIIGRNGAGKSTLLQLICGILKATEGTVQVNGRVIALLELGAGFNPEFTGRENVYFQGALMGLTKAQMDERFDEIMGFAEIGEFVEQPVRTYSSGMFVRLAFASAMHLTPEILVVDEALAVGDAGFQKKCFDKIDSLRERGGVVLLVSHSMEQIAHHCDRVILLEGGTVTFSGKPSEAIHRYMGLFNNLQGPEKTTKSTLDLSSDDKLLQRPHYNRAETRWGDRASTIVDACVVQSGIEDPPFVVPGVPIEIKFWSTCHLDCEKLVFGLAIKSRTGAMVLATNSRVLLGPGEPLKQLAGSKLCISFFFTPFFEPGDYLVSIGVTSEAGTSLLTHDRRYDSIILNLRTPIPNDENSNRSLSCRVDVIQASAAMDK
jgi:lipopolysaccharide transport system ATP-binding protein